MHSDDLGIALWVTTTVAELIKEHQESSISQPSSMPGFPDPVVERAIVRCLEHEAHRRPKSAHEVAAGLPGGDPLAAALAAGETPSPEMVAAAGKQEATQPMVAISLAILGLVIFIGVTRWAGTMSILHHLPLQKPPEVLIDRAREMLNELGYREPAYSDPADQAWGFSRDGDEFNGPFEAFREMPDAVTFWYRQSPTLIVPHPTKINMLSHTSGRVSPTNPRPVAAGEVTVILDLTANLQRFEVAVKRMSSSAGEEPDDRIREPLQQTLFSQAGLDPSRFRTDHPRYQPFHNAADSAWIGTRPQLPDVEVRVETGFDEERPFWFDVSTSSITEPLTQGPEPALATPHEVILTSLPSLLRLIVMLFCIQLTVRNLKQGRADRRGALRLALFLGSLQFAIVCLRSHVLFTAFWATELLVLVGTGVLYGLFAWSIYVAMEPFGRRVWPRMFVSLSRLLSRPRIELRDPLLGRSVLFGLVAGPAIHLSLFPLLGTSYDFNLLLGQQQAIAGLLSAVMWIGSLFFGVMSLVVLRLLVQRTWLAAGLNVILLSLIQMTGTLSTMGMIGLLIATVVSMAVLLRWGIVAYLVANLTSRLIGIGRTTDWSAWHAQAANMALALVVALAIYGAWAAMGDRAAQRI